KFLIMLLHVGPVVVTRARKADQLPTDHVAVAAVDRIAEKAFDSVLQQHLEERLGLDSIELDVALLEPGQNLVLLVRRQRAECAVAEGLAAVIVDRLDRRAIAL